MKCVVFKLWQFFSICCFPQSIGWYPHCSHIATTTGILIFSYICVEFRGFTFSSLLVSSLKKGGLLYMLYLQLLCSAIEKNRNICGLCGLFSTE